MSEILSKDEEQFVKDNLVSVSISSLYYDRSGNREMIVPIYLQILKSEMKFLESIISQQTTEETDWFYFILDPKVITVNKFDYCSLEDYSWNVLGIEKEYYREWLREIQS